jgi:hypothetical protein
VGFIMHHAIRKLRDLLAEEAAQPHNQH